jgi:hypothetical protein
MKQNQHPTPYPIGQLQTVRKTIDLLKHVHALYSTQYLYSPTPHIPHEALMTWWFV